ncbi:MAG: hypothetical protein H0W88_08655 [Parachlamydiaceae bacterium]|nr:hypothetical protein [Parachlamydiaceae bacterium]
MSFSLTNGSVPKSGLSEATIQSFSGVTQENTVATSTTVVAAQNALSEQNDAPASASLSNRTIVKTYEGPTNFLMEAPIIRIPDAIREKLTEEQRNKIEELCKTNFMGSVKVLEKSMAEAALTEPKVDAFLSKLGDRVITFIEAYASVMADKDHSNKEILTLKYLSDLFLESPKQTIDYAGNVGANPITIRNALKDGNYREKMHLITEAFKWAARNKIFNDPEMVKLMNQKSGLTWELTCDPKLGTLGNYAALTGIKGQELRKFKPDATKSVTSWKGRNPTVADLAETRVPLSRAEAEYTTGQYGRHFRSTEFQVKTGAGAAVFNPTTVADREHPYLRAASELGLPLMAGISGSSDQFFSLMNALGFKSKEDLTLGLLACLGGFIKGSNHTSIEVLAAAKSFGFEYNFSADSYKMIDPDNRTSFLELLVAEQKKNRYEMPDYYLSQEYVTKIASKLGYI